MFNDELMNNIRGSFELVEECPYQGKRIFFENAGGALTLKSVVDKSKEMAAIPDNQGRNNPAAHELQNIIDGAKENARAFFGAKDGVIFAGESGTELLFRIISTAIVATAKDCDVIGSTVEHPASRSAAIRWAGVIGANYISVPHNDENGNVTADDYSKYVTENTKVATILHTSPVTGVANDVKAIAASIRAVSPECFIIVDGIQQAAHGALDIDSYDIDGYVISPYKVFSRHGYGLGWVSPRLSVLPHNSLIGGPEDAWELGTRDTGSYATFSEVVNYFDWLGGHFSNSADLRERLVAAGKAVMQHEKDITDLMINGTGDVKGLKDYDNVTIIGGIDNPGRKGLVSFYVDGMDSVDVVSALSDRQIRVHVRKNDHYSGNVLIPLNQPSCIRVSMCHYNTAEEIITFLKAIKEIV
ncbi:aminotransferase class V-fold PLP-dependent enzyme [Pseudemcibacter aquimaris]|uniref:aminotransferase class V-fold PLP-dependent enzyme n=1 Tax=Pseudemcibacter aquimaris TaxID=2857064 RepID=UPI0020133CED|nr:aminotransferase class V-fold PLP-dependent enzyme [Pseudemcibacter aquimaris]MCC3861129.1 aminotransferase class V-fold PLP-dependent enzyme [Pseudemcibacter aquimaris]WDU59946.1 aminotransferase class V-fold PLP-dependent enzyme [Pseudemcibacter aquimaris]